MKINKANDHSKYANWINPEKVIPYQMNAKQHTEKQINNICTSIRRFGWQQDTVLTTDNVLVIGHGRRLAALKLGCEMPYHVIDKTADELTDKDIRELRIADNQTNAETGLDFDVLNVEIADLDFDGFDFDFATDESGGGSDFFNRENRNDTSREEGNDEYNDFLEKFEAKKTTDDCYTPDNIYNAVADWVAQEYKVNKANFVRPFYPGGDYQAENYKPSEIVVDNPPFSIFSEILRFYCEKGIRFFLFAPTLTLFSGRGLEVEYIPTGVGVVYENGASVNTSFITNMGKNRVRSAPTLYKVVDAANDENLAAMHKDLPNYSYPDEVITAAMVGRWSKYGVDFSVPGDECVRISELDEQKEQGKGIFGGGFLLSKRAAAERAAAERAAAERAAAERAAAERAVATKWELSEREREIVRNLGK